MPSCHHILRKEVPWMEPIIDLIWSVEEELQPDYGDMLMSNCGGCGGCYGTPPPPVAPFLKPWVCG